MGGRIHTTIMSNGPSTYLAVQLRCTVPKAWMLDMYSTDFRVSSTGGGGGGGGGGGRGEASPPNSLAFPPKNRLTISLHHR